MANPKGLFSPELVQVAWFDAGLQASGWFEESLVSVVEVGGTDAVSLAPISTLAASLGPVVLAQRHSLPPTAISTLVGSVISAAVVQQHALAGVSLITLAGSLQATSMAQAHALSSDSPATIIGEVPTLDAFEAISHSLSSVGIETIAQAVPVILMAQGHAVSGLALVTLAQSAPVIVASYGHAFSGAAFASNPSSLGIPTIHQRHAVDPESIATLTQGVPFLGMPTAAPGVRGHVRDSRVRGAARTAGQAGHIYGAQVKSGAASIAAIDGKAQSASAQVVIASVAMAGKIHAPYVAKGKWGAR